MIDFNSGWGRLLNIFILMVCVVFAYNFGFNDGFDKAGKIAVDKYKQKIISDTVKYCSDISDELVRKDCIDKVYKRFD